MKKKKKYKSKLTRLALSRRLAKLENRVEGLKWEQAQLMQLLVTRALHSH